jgi:hypothetical protein
LIGGVDGDTQAQGETDSRDANQPGRVSIPRWHHQQVQFLPDQIVVMV